MMDCAYHKFSIYVVVNVLKVDIVARQEPCVCGLDAGIYHRYSRSFGASEHMCFPQCDLVDTAIQSVIQRLYLNRIELGIHGTNPTRRGYIMDTIPPTYADM
jgi:hypothetical protein